MDACNASRSSLLLKTPVELRRQIYENVLSSQYPISHYRYTRFIEPGDLSSLEVQDKVKSLLLVSKQVSEEALDVLYGGNTFEVLLHGGGGRLMSQFSSEANRRKIRKLQIVLQPQGITYLRLSDVAYIFPMFSQLKKLSIVAQQPFEVPTEEDSSLELEVDWWMKWLREMLARIVPQLTTPINVVVDDNNLKETSNILQEYFPGGFRRVKTRQGDFIFKRGEFYWSWESGYWDDDGYEASMANLENPVVIGQDSMAETTS